MQNRVIGVRMLKRAVFTTAVAGLLAGQLLTAQTASSPQVVARAEAPPETTTTGPSSPTTSAQQSELGVVDELNAMKRRIEKLEEQLKAARGETAAPSSLAPASPLPGTAGSGSIAGGSGDSRTKSWRWPPFYGGPKFVAARSPTG